VVVVDKIPASANDDDSVDRHAIIELLRES
jgi:hypothetical protein